MAAKRFHLGWFMNFTPDEWDAPTASAHSPLDGTFFVDMAKAMERACFDYIMIEDTLMISDAYGGTTEAYLKNAIKGPQHDPAPLAAMIGASTSRLGVVATMSTMAYPPFMLARLSSTLDHICHGRFGWNIVTSRRGLRRAELRHGRIAAAAGRATTWPTSTSSCASSCGAAGTTTRSCATTRPAPSPITARSGRSISRAGSSSAAGP